VPRFNVSSVRAKWPRPVLGLLAGGLILGVVAVSVHLAAPLRVAALVPYVAGAGLYLDDVVRLTSARRRPAAPGITPVGQVAAAAVFVVAALAALPAIAGVPPWPQVAVTSALLGWAPLAISANGARIIPFLAWTRGGVPGAAPLAADRIPIAAGVGQLALLGAGWLLLETGILAQSSGLVRAGALLSLIGALALPTLIALALRGRLVRGSASTRGSHLEPGRHG
jgi:hypothetical protein